MTLEAWVKTVEKFLLKICLINYYGAKSSPIHPLINQMADLSTEVLNQQQSSQLGFMIFKARFPPKVCPKLEKGMFCFLVCPAMTSTFRLKLGHYCKKKFSSPSHLSTRMHKTQTHCVGRVWCARLHDYIQWNLKNTGWAPLILASSACRKKALKSTRALKAVNLDLIWKHL